MKKMLLLLALGGFLISAPYTIWASDNEEKDWFSSDEENNAENDYTENFMVGRPCRIRFSSKEFG